jgi:uncharacterized membrane protein YphA (DoxX/SURF4 family)
MATISSPRVPTIALWAFKAIIALAFLLFGAMKLAGAPMLVKEFDVLGLGQGFRILTGVVEVVGAALLLIPATFRLGALVLLAVSIGACIAQATRLHGDVIHTLVLIAATGFLSWRAWRPSAA